MNQKIDLNQPIQFEYSSQEGEREFLQRHASVRELHPIHDIPRLTPYFDMKLSGARKEHYTRESIWIRLKEVSSRLESYQLQFLILDVFRSRETQQALLEDFSKRIRNDHPDFDDDAVLELTRKFVADPALYEGDRVLPHNSGGAIDLAFTDVGKVSMCEMGGEFDDPTEISRTDFYESDFDPKWGVSEETWEKARLHRRVLFNVMKSAGFTNYENEWWHYDLGNGNWARRLGVDPVYGSMEAAVNDHIAGC